jgi:hypothetical protein
LPEDEIRSIMGRALPPEWTVNWLALSKSDFKNLFQSSLKEMLTKKDKQGKKNAEGDSDSLDMNV